MQKEKKLKTSLSQLAVLIRLSGGNDDLYDYGVRLVDTCIPFHVHFPSRLMAAVIIILSVFACAIMVPDLQLNIDVGRTRT